MTHPKARQYLDTLTFADLPIDKSHPHHSAWIWGPDDGLGTLNYLTEDIVLAASKEIKTGKRVCLNWNLQHPKYPGFKRQPFAHEVFQKGDRIVCDDTVHFNTQHSSQWDGFRHFGYQEEALFYNNTTLAQILAPDATPSCGRGMARGMAEWATAGIAGRGVLLDIVAYCHTISHEYDPWSTDAIPLTIIEGCARHQNVAFHKGDILVMRTGYHVVYEAASEAQVLSKSETNPPAYAGVAQDLAIAEWIYNHKFAAVAGDAPAFESWPVDTSVFGCALHEIFLGGWGMPIGELWYLEDLATMCAELKQWTFFLSSSPLNVPGGVASSPNVMAIF